jgi:hypothetical protein
MTQATLQTRHLWIPPSKSRAIHAKIPPMPS